VSIPSSAGPSSVPGSTIVDSLAYWATCQPTRPFLCEGEQTFTYGEFYGLVGQCASTLEKQGFRYGDRIVLYLQRKSAYIAAYFAALSRGVIPVLIYPERPASFVRFVVDAVAAKGVWTLDKWTGEGDCFSVIPWLDEAAGTAPDLANIRHPIAYLMFTSGTTRVPKAVMTTQQNVMAVTKTLIEQAGMPPGVREVIFMPLGSTGGLGHLHAVLMLGGTIVLLPWFMAAIGDPELRTLLAVIEREKIDGFLATPRLVRMLLAEHRSELSASAKNLRYMLTNVSPLERELIVDLLNLLPNLHFCTYYGLTEASRSIFNPCRRQPGYEHATGFPVPGVELKLTAVDPHSQVGEVLLRGPNLFAGYWGEERQSLVEDGWFPTGDLGRMDEQGRLYVLGRKEETINIDGLKFLPIQVESVLSQYPAIQACAVVALPDPLSYQRVGAAVQLRDPDASLEEKNHLADAILAHCRDKLDSYQLPSKVHILPELPQTDLGKVKRGELISMLDSGLYSFPRP
jgi:long-chain acyl-CoA synthetase